MTLVVGKKFSDGNVQLFSDIKLTSFNQEPLKPWEGALKTWMIQQDLAISYAGNIDAPVRLREKIDNSIIHGGVTWKKILQLAKTVADEFADTGADFIIASARGNGKLAKVTSVSIQDNLDTAWIGDFDAFTAFQGILLSEHASNIVSYVERVWWAFGNFIRNSNVLTTGYFSFNVTIVYDNNRRPYFDYVLGSETTNGFVSEPIRPKAGVWTTLKLGDAGDGVCSVSRVKSAAGEMTGVGLYFPEGRFGFFFCPRHSTKPLVFRDVDSKHFVKLISETIGVHVQGCFSSGNGFWLYSYPEID